MATSNLSFVNSNRAPASCIFTEAIIIQAWDMSIVFPWIRSDVLQDTNCGTLGLALYVLRHVRSDGWGSWDDSEISVCIPIIAFLPDTDRNHSAREHGVPDGHKSFDSFNGTRVRPSMAPSSFNGSSKVKSWRPIIWKGIARSLSGLSSMGPMNLRNVSSLT